jgi:hypothetical protein
MIKNSTKKAWPDKPYLHNFSEDIGVGEKLVDYIL